MWWLFDYFQIRVPSFFVNINTFLEVISIFFYVTYLFFNVYWFLYILKPALLPHANTQSPDVVSYLPHDYTTSQMSLCTGLTAYQVKKLTPGECVSGGSEKICSSQKGWGASNCILTFRWIHTGFEDCK